MSNLFDLTPDQIDFIQDHPGTVWTHPIAGLVVTVKNTNVKLLRLRLSEGVKMTYAMADLDTLEAFIRAAESNQICSYDMDSGLYIGVSLTDTMPNLALVKDF